MCESSRTIRLIFKGISEIMGSDEIALLILTDEKQERQISIVCDKYMAYQIELRMKFHPISEDLLPEVLYKMLITRKPILEIHISGIDDGQYRVYLCNRYIPPIPIRASDAVLLSLIGNVDIRIKENLMQKQSVPYEANARGVSLPVNTISDDMLQKALEKAIEQEDYELASHLRDEKKRRKRKPLN